MNPYFNAREQQIQDLLMRGYENREIGAELGISLRTVKAYMHRMFKRNDIRDGVKRVKLAVKLYRKSLYGPSPVESQPERSSSGLRGIHVSKG